MNEILGKEQKRETVSQININDVPESDPTKIANHFNTFFTSIGTKIANNVQNVTKKTRRLHQLWSGHTGDESRKYHA